MFSSFIGNTKSSLGGETCWLLQQENLKSWKLQNSSAMYVKVKSFNATFCIFRPEADRSESEIEDEEAFEMDSDGSEESSLRVPISTSSSLPVKMSTPQAGGKAGEHLLHSSKFSTYNQVI